MGLRRTTQTPRFQLAPGHDQSPRQHDVAVSIFAVARSHCPRAALDSWAAKFWGNCAATKVLDSFQPSPPIFPHSSPAGRSPQTVARLVVGRRPTRDTQHTHWSACQGVLLRWKTFRPVSNFDWFQHSDQQPNGGEASDATLDAPNPQPTGAKYSSAPSRGLSDSNHQQCTRTAQSESPLQSCGLLLFLLDSQKHTTAGFGGNLGQPQSYLIGSMLQLLKIPDVAEAFPGVVVDGAKRSQ